MTDHRMDPAEVERLLAELRRRLQHDEVAATLHVIGGSAMALRFPDDDEVRTTRDIDAAYEPKAAVQKVIADMAEEFGLSPTWMNSSGTPFIPDRSSRTGERAVVTFSIATVEELIAMKLAASREQDLYDLGILARHAGITDPDALVEIAFAAYGEDSMTLTESAEDYRMMAAQALQDAERRARRGRRR